MKKILVILERGVDGVSAYTADSIFSGFGETAEAAKEDLKKQIEFYKKTCKEDGYKYPAFLDEDYQLVYKFDVESVLNFYSGILTNAGLEKVTGINQKQLSGYANGRAKPRKAQIERIKKGLHSLGEELKSIDL